jgi:hypothetical protein
MKTLFAALAAIALIVSAPVARAQENAQLDVAQLALDVALNDASTLNLINWKVGETANYNVSAAFGFIKGTMTKSVASEEGNAIWVRQEVVLAGQNQLIEILMDRADGKVLKMRQNGKDAQVPDEKPEIISQDYAEITVPAGTFKCVHVIAKTKSASKVEIWANPVDTVMEGAVKQIAGSQIGDVTMEMTSFKKVN